MNWMTRCPACGAVYQVVPDQLKIARGWLRCGQCRHTFDSTGMVLDWPDAVSEQDGQRVVVDDLLKQKDDSPLTSTAITALASFEEALATFKPQPLSSVQDSGLAGSSGAQMPSPAESEARQGRPWRGRLGVLLLSLALLLQWLWIERHVLAATQGPAVSTALHAVCRVIKCDILPLQIRDGVVIDGSSLTPHDEGFLFSWSVRNVTAHPLQMPALELTLLDAQGKALVRRVLLVTQHGAPPVLASEQMWAGQLHLLPEPGLLPAGYRVISFYP